jgi:hypothetical protein
MNDEPISKEERILRAVKFTLTGVIKDTATTPGLKHPLSEKTIEDLRHCLVLITERETELREARGEEMRMRPRFVDEPTPGHAEVSLSSIKGRNEKKSDEG